MSAQSSNSHPERVVVVTGAAGGIGGSTADAFARAQFRVVLLDIDLDTVNRRARELVAQGFAAESGHLDLADDSTIAPAVDKILAAYGRIDVLCNVAGINDALRPVHLQTDDMWDRVFAVNLRGPFQLTRAVLPSMLAAGGGVIVNVASVAGLQGGRSGAAYTASKHGLIGLTKNVATTYGELGVRCNVVCPGSTDTGMPFGGDVDQATEQLIARLRSSMPRRAVSEEIASVIVFLASDGASFINGATVVADGGWTAF